MANSTPAPRESMTIGALAQTAGVGVETVRFYQRRGLLPQPARAYGSIRRYGPTDAARLRFIRRAQELGFTLEEIGELLKLQDGTDRRAIRRIARVRLEQVESRLADLERMRLALRDVIHDCEHTPGAPRCPVIEAIDPGASEA
ncbi:MAG TPA: MerR family transcriptional regulator [Burkholderiaceae bacterium]|nr:MerR family transcriptional regulator [Burkholderiaceae bacterium]